MYSTARSAATSRIPRRSSSVTDVRVSVGPSGFASDVRRSIRPPMGRRSSSLSHVDRATCGRPSLSQGKRQPVKDNRPLNDKEYQQECAHRLHSFLACYGSAPQLTAQQMMRMSNKQFASIFVFLVNIMDPYFKLGTRAEDDIMNMLQILKYPFALSKSMLPAIGSRLPLALGILTWLLDVVEYYESVDIFDHLVTDDATLKASNQVGTNHLSKIMQYGLETHGASVDISAEDEDFLHKLAEDVHGKMEPADDLLQELHQVEKEVQKREAQKAEYLEQLEAVANNRIVIEQMESFIQNFDQFYSAKQNALKDLQRGNASREEEIELLRKELEHERARLDEQKQRGVDRETLENQLKQAKASLELAQQKLESEREEKGELELRWCTCLHQKQSDTCKIEKLYSEICRSLESFPKPVPAILKSFRCDGEVSMEHLEQQHIVLNDVLDALDEIELKNLSGAKKETELAQRYKAECEEAARDLQREKEIFDQAITSHAKVKQGLLKQIDDKKEEHAQLQKELIIVQSQTVATCTDQSFLSLQQRVAAADAEYKELKVKVEMTKARCEDDLEAIKTLAEEKMKGLMRHFQKLQELLKAE